MPELSCLQRKATETFSPFETTMTLLSPYCGVSNAGFSNSIEDVYKRQGVQCGTIFIAASECTAHEVYKQKVIAAGDTDTIVTGKTLGHPVRALKTPFTRKFAQMENDPNQTPEAIMEFGSGSLRKACLLYTSRCV